MENNNFKNNENNLTENVKSENKNVQKSAKKEKRKTVFLIVIVLVLVLIVGLVGGIFISGNGDKIAGDIINITEKKEENKVSKKIDESRAWVYDADYLNGREDKKRDGKYQVSTDLKFPYININSEDGKRANEEIAKLYDDLYNEFGSAGLTHNFETKRDEVDDSSYMITEASYEYFENDNILSVIITYWKIGVPGDGQCDYVTYNFNLDTLKFATLDDVCKVCEFSSQSDIREKINITVENLANIPEVGFDENAEWDNKTFYIDRSKILNVRLPGVVQFEMIEIYNDVIRSEKKGNETTKKSEINNLFNQID